MQADILKHYRPAELEAIGRLASIAMLNEFLTDLAAMLAAVSVGMAGAV